jgi:C_GCAxxG_C_C family probable redox protein
MDRKQFALDTHAAGFNCAQAVFAALEEGSARIDRRTALRVSACFGGGMRCGEVCGAVTGALMALGLERGFDDPADLDGKTRAAAMARAFHAEFRRRHGTLICRELLGEDPGAPGAVDRLKARGKMPAVCNGAISDAVDIVENLPV